MMATRKAASPAAMTLLGWYGGRPVNWIGDVAAMSNATYTPLTVGSPMAGLAAPLEPLGRASCARRLAVLSPILATYSSAHCWAFSRPGSAGGAPVSGAAGASVTAVAFTPYRRASSGRACRYGSSSCTMSAPAANRSVISALTASAYPRATSSVLA